MQDLSRPDSLHFLTVRQLHETLKQRGVEISYSSLSEFLNTDDIAALLRIEGGGNARRILPDVTDVLAAFWPHYRQSKGRLTQASQMLKAFLQRETEGIVPGSLVTVPEIAHTPKLPDPYRLAWEQGRAQGLAIQDRPLTAKEAASLLGIGVETLRECIPPYNRFGKTKRGDRWLLSDLMARK